MKLSLRKQSTPHYSISSSFLQQTEPNRFFVSFVEEVWQVDSHMMCFKNNQDKRKNVKRSYEGDAFGKKFNLNMNFVPLKKSHNESNLDGLILRHNLDLLIPETDYGRMQSDDFTVFDKLFLHTKPEETDTWLKHCEFDKYDSCRKTQIVIYHRTRLGEKLYECSECRKRFIKKSSLIKHQNRHIRELAYAVVNVAKPFSRNHSLLHITELILERNLTTVASVGKPSPRSHSSHPIRGHIQERNPMSALNVGKPLVRSQVLQHIRELTREKNHMNAGFAKRPSPRNHS